MNWWEFHQPNRDVDLKLFIIFARPKRGILGSIVVSIPACHAGDRGSIPRRGERYIFFPTFFYLLAFHFLHKMFILEKLGKTYIHCDT